MISRKEKNKLTYITSHTAEITGD